MCYQKTKDHLAPLAIEFSGMIFLNFQAKRERVLCSFQFINWFDPVSLETKTTILVSNYDIHVGKKKGWVGVLRFLEIFKN